MAGFVLDCSLALAWFLPQEATASATALLDRAAEDGVTVPGIWRLEVGNALLTAERRRRITSAHRRAALAALGKLPVTVDGETSDRAWGDALAIAATQRLTLYDAAYVELAQRRSLPLASLDGELRAAATKLGVSVLGK